MKRAVTLALSLLFVSLYLTAQTLTEMKQQFLKEGIGNWYEPNSNSWDYGFFEEFAIHDGGFWNYTIVKKRKNGYVLVLANEVGDEKKLEVSQEGNTLRIKEGKNKPVAYHKVDKFLPDYTTVDTSTFVDTKFSRLDTATIVGYLRNNSSNEPFRVSISDWLTGGNEEYFGNIDEFGRFEIKIPLYNTTQVYMDWRRSFLIDVFEPGEKVFLFLDLDTKETIYHGKTARFHNELANYNFSTSYWDLLTDEHGKKRMAKMNYENQLSYEDLLIYKKNEWDSLERVNAGFFDNHPQLSSKVCYYIESKTSLKIAKALVYAHLDRSDHVDKHAPPTDYTRFLKDNFIDKQIFPKSLVRENLDVANHYMYMDTAFQMSVDFSTVIVDLIRQGKIKADKSITDYAELSTRAMVDDEKAMHVFTPQDSLHLAQLQERDPNIANRYYSLYKDYESLIRMYASIELSLNQPKLILQKHFDRDWFDILYSHKVYSVLSEGEALPPEVMDDVIQPIQHTFFKEQVITKNDGLRQRSSAALRYEENLRNTDHLAESKDADKIIADILAPHKGKVVYIDFWGTWCGPCIAEMEYVPAAKKALEGKDVVFVYFANRTDKTAWVNFIKQKNLEGENVIHYNLPQEQQSIVERRLGVRSFPTYMLVDTEGNFVNTQAPRPSQKDQLVREIDKLLAK